MLVDNETNYTFVANRDTYERLFWLALTFEAFFQYRGCVCVFQSMTPTQSASLQADVKRKEKALLEFESGSH